MRDNDELAEVEEASPHEGEVIAVDRVRPKRRRGEAGDKHVLMRLKFAQAYVQTNGNAREAARLAGYSGDDNTLSAVASELMDRADVKSYLSEVIRSIISSEETSAILSDLARSSIGCFLARDANGNFINNGFGFELDLNSEEAQANLHVIKKLKPTKFGVEIELHSKTHALDILARGLEIRPSELVKKLQVQAVLDALPEEVREPIRALIASAEARRLNENEALLEP